MYLDIPKNWQTFGPVSYTHLSDNTKKMFRNMCKYYEVPMEIFATKEELGHWIGKAYRASICILDEGFAKSIVKKINLNMEG